MFCISGPSASAAPHARGSTRQRRDRAERRVGCPACAGIDPKLGINSDGEARLPRMRGDRPGSRPLKRVFRPAAPHARGSTPLAHLRSRPPRGCPACAGIDPACASSKRSALWLPRMRGDRPDDFSLRTTTEEAAPHARGSTQALLMDPLTTGGCPACAGIDPGHSARCPPSLRLPRMRGDRPAARSRRRARRRAAPHARGSTRAALVVCLDVPGCPACAGIDPIQAGGRNGAPWLPRMRGDRPYRCSRRCTRSRAAPHARGSTHVRRSFDDETPGCPACAGIDPS